MASPTICATRWQRTGRKKSNDALKNEERSDEERAKIDTYQYKKDRRGSSFREEEKTKRKGWHLGDGNEAKAKSASKGGRQSMECHLQEWSRRAACIASETLIPRETPMCTLCSGVSLWRWGDLFLLRLKRL